MKTIDSLFMNQQEFRMFLLFAFLAVFFQVSRRLSARLEEAPPASRPLTRLALALAIPKAPLQLAPDWIDFANKTKLGLAWLLKKTDWLFYDKLKTLPDARTGKRLNLFMMLFASWLVAKSETWLPASNTMIPFISFRQSAVDPQKKIWEGFFYLFVYSILLLLPLFLIRTNREFYFDVLALFVVLAVGMEKLIYCWLKGRGECCFGIPWRWGIYNEILETTVFPSQLLEFGLGVMCTVLGILFMLFSKYYKPGRGCSFSMFAYTLSRFFAEFFRYHGEGYRAAEANVFLGLSMAQVVCVAGAAVGVAWWFILPLEKKLIDGFWRFAAARWRKRAARQEEQTT